MTWEFSGRYCLVVTTNRDEAKEDLERLIVAVDELEERLEATKKVYQASLDSLKADQPLGDTLRSVGAAGARQAMTDALDRFEQLRHNSRLSMIATGLDEGMTINGLSKVWGISRQLASRLVKEVRDRS
jgi:hypothetical protein